jgi:hypothetical protein
VAFLVQPAVLIAIAGPPEASLEVQVRGYDPITYIWNGIGWLYLAVVLDLSCADPWPKRGAEYARHSGLR